MARFPYAAAGCEGHTAEHGSFRPANNSPSHRHWPLRASHVSFYSALFLRNLRPAPRRSAFGGGFNRHIIRPGREIARKIFPRSGLPFWAPCRLPFSVPPGPPVSLSSRTPSVSLSGGGQKKRRRARMGPSPLGMYGVCLTWQEPPRPPWPRQQPWPSQPGPS